MKEIKYEGDLSKNLIKSSKKFNLIRKTLLLIEVSSLFFIALIILSINLSPLASILLSSIVTGGALISSYLFSWPLLMHDDLQEELEKVTYKIKNNTKVDMSVKELKKVKEIQKVEIISKINETREEKIIKYFEFLDRNDQIQILKHVKTTVNENETNNKLFLLENKDLEKENIYIKK